jgi:hypothetical protein
VYQHLLEASSIFFSKKKEKPKFLVGIDESLKISKIIDLWKNDRS